MRDSCHASLNIPSQQERKLEERISQARTLLLLRTPALNSYTGTVRPLVGTDLACGREDFDLGGSKVLILLYGHLKARRICV